MEENKNINRRKSIMVIDKKGQAKEVSKDIKKGEISTLIDSTDKTEKTKANVVDNLDKYINSSNNLKTSNIENKDNIENNDLSNSKLINKGLDDSNLNSSKVDNNITNEGSASNKLENSKLIDDNTEGTTDKKTLSLKQSPENKYRNVEIAAGVTAGTAAAVLAMKNKENENKHVTINEQENEEHEVSNDGRSIPLTESDKHNLRTRSPTPSDQNNSPGLSTFSPQRISSNNLHEDSEILSERENNNVEGEGHFFKRRRIFACFWHEKYFLLTKTGILKYYKANGTRVSKGNWDLRNVQRIHEVFMGGESHPFRLALMSGDENLLFGFDDSDNREYWLIKLSKYINK